MTENKDLGLNDTQTLVAMADPNENKPDGSVLAVDDDELMQKLLPRVLAKGMHIRSEKIVVCSSVRDAILSLDAGQSPSVILSDINMPVATGAAFYDHLKTTRPQLIPRTLFMTGGGNGSSSLDTFIQKMGLRQRCISKPFDVAELIGMINQILEDQRQD